MRFLFPLFFISLTYSSFSQYQYNNTNSDTLPDAFKVSASQLRSHIYDGIPEKYKVKRKERGLFHFSDQNAVSIAELISSGDIYSDWPSLEKYLNQVLQKIMPEEVKNDSVIHAYVTKDGSFNAYMTPTGMTFIHIALLTYVDDEATLAAVLAHELAHYYKRHSLMRYIKDEGGEFAVGRRKSMSRFSIHNELECDSLSMHWLKEAGYNLEGSLRGFQIMKQLQNKRIMRLEKKWELEATTHPLPDERMNQFNDFISKNEAYKGADYVVSQEQFVAFKEEAKKEVLKYLLEDFNYYNCSELAFKFHVLDPGNPVYIHYILESIRRSCYMDATLWGKNFIVDRFYKSFDEKGDLPKTKWPTPLLASFEADILGISPQEKEKIKAMVYWEVENPPFVTYEQAFVFFYGIARKMKDHEAILTNALSVNLDTNIRNTLLREYLQHPNIKYRAYAEHLLAGDILSMLPNKILTVIGDQNISLRQGKEEIPVRSDSDLDKLEIRSLLDTVLMDFSDRDIMFLEDLNYYELGRFKILADLKDFGAVSTLSRGQKLEFHILEPRFWDIYRQYGVNEIEFINYYFLETRKSEKSISAYQEALEMNYQDLFSHTKRARDLYLFFSSVRLKQDQLMKIRYYEYAEFKFRKPTRPQFISLMKKHIEEKDKEAEQKDNTYQYYHVDGK